MRAVHAKDTAPELFVRSMLYRLGYRFRLHLRTLPGAPDIVIPGRKRVIFVHGCFWHGHDCARGQLPTSNVAFWEGKIHGNKERDARVRKQLESEGWVVLTIWQCETKDAAILEQRLVRFLGQPTTKGNDSNDV